MSSGDMMNPGNAPAAPLEQAGSAATPSQPAPHGRLVNIIQNVALGLDAFAKSAATGGREGGVSEVQAYRQREQQAQQQAAAASQALNESKVRMQHTQALTNVETVRLSQMQAMQPLELTKAQNDVFSSEVKALQEAGFSPSEISMIENQSTADHIGAVNAKAGGDFVGNAAIPVYKDGKHGAGGATYLTPFDKLRKITWSGDQLKGQVASLQSQVDQAKALGLGDSPLVKVAQGRLDAIPDGASINGADFHSLALSIMSPVSQAVGQKMQLTDMQKKVSEASTAGSESQIKGAEAGVAGQTATLGVQQKKATLAATQATTSKTQAETAKTIEETKQLKGLEGLADGFGNKMGVTSEGQALDMKEFKKRADTFSKEYVQPLNVLKKTSMEFDRIDKNPNQTGAEKVTALLNAVGISGDPLKGKGFRISNDVIREHAHSRNIWESGVQKLNTIFGSGGPITSQQISDYRNVAEGVVHDAYVSASQEAQRQGLSGTDFLPKPSRAGQVVDKLTAKIYLDAAGGNIQKAQAAIDKAGYK